MEFELNENEKNIVKDLNKKVLDYLSKNNLTFDKDRLFSFTLKVYSNIGSLENSEISNLAVKNFEDMTFLQNQYIAVKLAVDYLKFIKENYANKFRLKYREMETEGRRRQTLSDIERELSTDSIYIAIKYLILVYESNYLSRIVSNLELIKTYKDIISREITIRGLKNS